MIYILPATLLLSLIIWLVIKQISSRRSQLHQIRLGLNQIKAVRLLLEHLPQHRGMANALLNGDKSFQANITKLQATIDNDLATIDRAFEGNAPAQEIDSRRQHVAATWQQIKQRLNSLSANESFEQHSALIAEVIYLIEDINSLAKISAHPNRYAQAIAAPVFNLLPQVIELCGQARGIGAGVTAKGELSPPAHTKLTFLHQRLASASKTISSQLQSLSMAGAPEAIPGTLINSNNSNINQLLTTIDNELLHSQAITLSTGDYFDKGTQAIDSNIKIFDAALGYIEQTAK